MAATAVADALGVHLPVVGPRHVEPQVASVALQLSKHGCISHPALQPDGMLPAAPRS
jgi:hypothetical protein